MRRSDRCLLWPRCREIPKIDGVEDVKVIVEDLLVLITFDSEKTTAEAINKSINEETTFNLALKEVKDKEEIDTGGIGKP